MVPSMGFFVVVPIVSCPEVLKLMGSENFEEILDRYAASIGWTYSFV